jgi:arabinose-5-phosphate isomerase
MVIKQAAEVLKIEAQSILILVDRLGPEFEDAVEIILNAKGRVILTGMGKSGLIARKISATFNSTGTPSLFLHPGEALHGDLGMVTGNDILLIVSNSGRTSEVLTILPTVKSLGAKIITFAGDRESPLARSSDVFIDVGVEREACPMGLAPTASTTAALAMGDALAVVLINKRRFGQDDFKKFHPGGNLGERLQTKVKEMMYAENQIPLVFLDSDINGVVDVINKTNLGVALVVRKNKILEGTITDGDLRRALGKGKGIFDMPINEIMSQSPKTIREDQTAGQALELMETHEITHLVVVDDQNHVKGLVHLHDLLGGKDFRINEVD